MSKIPTAARKDACVLRLWESDGENSDGGGAGDAGGGGDGVHGSAEIPSSSKSSFAAQSLTEHVADVKVPSEHDDTSEVKYPASHVGVQKSPERIVSGHVPKAPFDGGAALHDSARVNSSSLFSVA